MTESNRLLVDVSGDTGSRVRGWRPDAVTVTSIFVLLTYAMSQQLVFAPMGAAGRPAMLGGLAMAVWWLLTRFHPDLVLHGWQPVRALILLVVAVRVLAYAMGYDRGLDGLEAAAADREMLLALSMAGVALCIADGVRSRARLDVLIGRIVLAGAFMALVGIIQFFAKFDLSQYLVLPGLSWHTTVFAIGERGEGVARVAGTARHYIEFGAACGMLVPLAIHRARFAPTRGRAQARWVSAGLLAAAVPMAVSRTGILALALSLGVYSVVWGWRSRFNAAALAFCAAVMFAGVVPGLLGTLAKLFLNASEDPSVLARQEDYAPTMAYVADRPWFGRGPGTFLPDRYILLDNQYLYTLVTEGYVGLAALILLYAGAIILTLRIGRRAADAETRDLAQALLALFVVAAVVSGTFDSFSFAVFTASLFLALGCAGALWRLRAEPAEPGIPAARSRAVAPAGRGRAR
ncbi:MAG: O-antigen ligase family protein [Actinomycetes bacterium]